MWPILCTLPEWVPLLGGTPIFTYGILLGIAVVLGYLVALHLAQPRLTARAARFAFVATGIGGVLGARILPGLLSSGPTESLLSSGGVAWGGFVGGAMGAGLGAWALGVSRALVLDAASVGAALGLGLVRVGCLLHGCDYGVPYEGPFSVVYPVWDGWAGVVSAHHAGVSLVPVQALESVTGFALFAALCACWRAAGSGRLVLGFFGGYAVLRFLLESLRGDEDRGENVLGTGLSTGQWTSLGAVVAALGIVAWNYRQARSTRRT